MPDKAGVVEGALDSDGGRPVAVGDSRLLRNKGAVRCSEVISPLQKATVVSIGNDNEHFG